MTETHILLVRHGQTGWNEGAGQVRYRGQTDIPLDEVGHAQARALALRLGSGQALRLGASRALGPPALYRTVQYGAQGRRAEPRDSRQALRLSGESIAGIYASPLERAVQTAQPTAERLGLAVIPHPGLLDMHLGEWQGLTHAEAARRYPEIHRRWLKAPHTITLPGGENLAAVLERSQAAVNELIARHAGETVMLVGHQVVNKVLVCWLLGLDNSHYWRVTQDNACLNLFVHADDTFRVVTLNDTCHLRLAKA